MCQYQPVWLNMDLKAANTTIEMDCATGVMRLGIINK